MTALERVKKAFSLISRIPVSGDAVDVMALARNELLNAMEQLKEEEGENGG